MFKRENIMKRETLKRLIMRYLNSVNMIKIVD